MAAIHVLTFAASFEGQEGIVGQDACFERRFTFERI